MSFQANNIGKGEVANNIFRPDKKTQLPFFVYGTLRPGQENYALLRGYTNQEQVAAAQNFRLYRLGYLPVAIAGEGIIIGNLLTINSRVYDNILTLLDSLEGYHPDKKSLYRRVQYPVMIADQKPIIAWLYQGDPQVAGDDREYIPHGDWIRFRWEQLEK